MLVAAPAVAEENIFHGELQRIEENIFLVEKPDQDPIRYLLVGENVEDLAPRSGLMARITGTAVMDEDDHNVIQMTEYTILTQPRQKDGPIAAEDQIGFIAEKGGVQVVYLIQPDGTHLKNITSSAAIFQNLRWSADGGMILFDRINQRGEVTLFVADMLSKQAREHPAMLPKPVVETSNAGYSPDGNFWIKSHSEDGSQALVLINLRTGEEKVLSEDGSNDFQPIWAHDNRRVLFLSDRSGENQIYILDTKTDKVTHLETAFPVSAADWTQNQDEIAFLANGQLLLISPESMTTRPLTEADLNCSEVNAAP